MSELDEGLKWNLLLIASASESPERLLNFLSGSVAVCGGWILSRKASGRECAEIDFEFPRANCVELYSVLVATGISLSREAHLQLTELCQCTMHLLESKAFDIVRLQLTVYTQVESADALNDADELVREAA